MKPTFTHTLGVELPRRIFSRESIKEMDKIFHTHKDVKPYYTGLAGRRMCFAFPTEEAKKSFAETFEEFLAKIQKKQ